MARKSVREMTFSEKLRNSISLKTFVSILAFSLVLSGIALAFGSYLYQNSIRSHYFSLANSNAQAAAMIFEEGNGRGYGEAIIGIYKSEIGSLAEDPNDQEYLSQFQAVLDENFDKIVGNLTSLSTLHKYTDIYIGAFDKQNGRIIYLMDSDNDGELYCYPGYWDTVSEKEKKEYERDATRPIVIEKTKRYGYTLTSWVDIDAIDGYEVRAYTDIDMTEVVDESTRFFWEYLLILLTVTFFMDITLVNRMRKQVVDPVNNLHKAAVAYKSCSPEELQSASFFSDVDVHTGDELENLAIAFSDMEADIKRHIRHVTIATATQERLSAELSIASQIQEGMIPNEFPPFPDRKEFDIYASMTPAKEVGGDFYDFFLMDDNHLAMVIADVSGKGIPGALFMMAVNILIRNTSHTIKDMDPALILKTVNERVCTHNPAEMFITVWLGILDVSTGRMVCSNAGHEYPYITENGQFRLLKDRHGLVMGAMDDSNYYNYELQMNPGDAVYVYTDGVTDSTDEEGNLFGNDRVTESLNRQPDADMKTLLTNVKNDIDDFVVDAPQFDDITMLGIRYMGPENKKGITVEAVVGNIDKVTDYVNQQLEGVSFKTITQIDIAVDEIFSNVAHYAYPEGTGTVNVDACVDENSDMAVITFRDQGIPFNPLKIRDPDVSTTLEKRKIGGLGIFMVKKMMDDISYEYKDGQNVLVMKKRYRKNGR